jgi:hypothetical protein
LFGLAPSIIQVTTCLGVLHVDVNPRVWIGQFPLRDASLHLDRFVLVEFRRERVVRRHGTAARARPTQRRQPLASFS